MTDDIDILVAPENLQSAVGQLQLQQVSPLKTGGYTGITAAGLRIDVVSPNQSWVRPAIADAVVTAHGPMVSGPYLVVSKLWDSRGSQDETDVLGVLGKDGERRVEYDSSVDCEVYSKRCG